MQLLAGSCGKGIVTHLRDVREPPNTFPKLGYGVNQTQPTILWVICPDAIKLRAFRSPGKECKEPGGNSSGESNSY